MFQIHYQVDYIYSKSLYIYIQSTYIYTYGVVYVGLLEVLYIRQLSKTLMLTLTLSFTTIIFGINVSIICQGAGSFSSAAIKSWGLRGFRMCEAAPYVHGHALS